MAYILDIDAQIYVPLASLHTFGRLATAVNTAINKPYISKLHTSIEWTGTEWRIKNLGQNGTWLNEKMLPTADSIALREGDIFHLVERTNQGFKVINLDPPSDMLWPQKNSADTEPKPIYLSRYHLLPDAQSPECAISFDQQTQQWHLETTQLKTDTHVQALVDGEIIKLAGRDWRLIRAQIYGPTEARAYHAQQLNEMEFVFNLSLDEEATQLELIKDQKRIDLFVRNHHYLLVQLVRHKANDIAKGLDSKSQGWIHNDQLANELGLDSTHMNIYIFRLRKQLADNLPHTLDLSNLIERRGGKIRFGCEHFKVYKGERLLLSSTQNVNPNDKNL